MKATLALVLALFVTTMGARAELKTATKIVAQPNSPVTITAYAAEYRERVSTVVQDGIHHDLQYQNKGAKPIVAVQFGLVSFDIWNEYLDRTNGVSLDILVAGKSQKGRWITNAYRGFSFLTGVAYVNRIRFDDGTIWTADTNEILDELRKIEKDFDASRLKKEVDPKP